MKIPPRDYPALCAHFEPRPIRSASHYRRTLAAREFLQSQRERRTWDQQDYLELLELLINRYEGIIPASKPSPLMLLRQLVEQHRLRKTDLSRILGKSLSLCSMILSGQRQITRAHAERLGKYFKIGPELFLT